MKNRLYLYLLFFVLLLVIIFFIFLANDFYYNLVIKTFPEEKIIFQKRISSEKKFALVYIHSVAQTPVWEFFKIDNEGNLILYETHFHDHGA